MQCDTTHTWEQLLHAGDMVYRENWKLGGQWLELSSPIQDWSVSGEIMQKLWPYYKLHVLYLLYLLYIPLLISSVLIHRVSNSVNTVHSCGDAWQPGQNWPHGMVSWSHSVALSERCSYDMWLCLASFASSSLLYSFNSFYYFKTQPGQTEQRTAESNVQSLDSLVALPVVRRHQDQTSKKWTIHLKCIRHRILLQCHYMIPSRHGKLRMLISEGKGCKNTEKHFLRLNRVSCGLSNDHWRLLLHVRRIVKFGFAAFTANAACQGGSHDAQHTGHPTQMQQYKRRWSQECCNHPAWPREKRIYWSVCMAHVTATKATYCQEAVLTRTQVLSSLWFWHVATAFSTIYI